MALNFGIQQQVAADPSFQQYAQNQQAVQQQNATGLQRYTQGGVPQEVLDYYKGYTPFLESANPDRSQLGGWWGDSAAGKNSTFFTDSYGGQWMPWWEGGTSVEDRTSGNSGKLLGYRTAQAFGDRPGQTNTTNLYFDPSGKYTHDAFGGNTIGFLRGVGMVAGAALGANAAFGGAGAAGGGAAAGGAAEGAAAGASGAGAGSSSMYSLGGTGTGFGGASTGMGMTAPAGYGTTGFGATAGGTGMGMTAGSAGAGTIGAGIGEGMLAGTGTMLGSSALEGATVLADGTVLAPASSYGAPTTSTMGSNAAQAGRMSSSVPSTGAGGMMGNFSWQDLVGPAMNLYNGAKGDEAIENATAAQLQAAREAMALTQPWRDKGVKGLNQLAIMLGLEGQGDPNFGALTRQFEFTQDDPSYQFRLNQGLKALKNSYAGKGRYLSGAAMKGISDYAQGAASQEYGQAFNRDLATRTNLFNRLASIAGTGQTAANTMGDLNTQAGNAQAAGQIGQAQAWNNALAGAYNTYTQNALMNQLLQQR